MQWHGTIVPMPAYHASGVPATLADASFEGVTPRFSPDPEMEVGEVRQQLETMAFSPTRGIRTDEHAGADTTMGEALPAADTSGLPTLASGSVSSLGGMFSGLQYHCRLRVMSSLASVVSVVRGSAAAVRPRWGANARRTATGRRNVVAGTHIGRPLVAVAGEAAPGQETRPAMLHHNGIHKDISYGNTVVTVLDNRGAKPDRIHLH
ncbi:MAG: hypothetical protein AN485_23555, partial [Anabaena sp. MDT14b]